jgi:type IV fimbrial biogenesis protein FimT
MHVSARRSTGGRPQAPRGFTMIELLVAVSLGAMLMVLALPGFTTWVRNSQIRSVAEALQNGVRQAQAESVRRNRPVVMTFTNVVSPGLNPAAAVNGNAWSMQTVASPFVDNNVAVLVGTGSFTNVASTVLVNTAGLSAICFNANGRLMGVLAASPAATANCTAAPVTLGVHQSTTNTNDRNLNVTVTVAGQVRMCDPALTLSSTSPTGC